MATDRIVRRFAAAYGGQASVRQGVVTDNGNCIVDVRALKITDPLAMETEVNQWPGVVTVGIFARHRARVCMLGTAHGVRELRFD
jgi:ribose 5-phosphate isomerase A